MWNLTSSSGMSRSAWLIASTRSSAVLVVLSYRPVGEHLPAVWKVRVVDLEDHPGIGDLLELIVQHVGEGEEELFVARVVLVPEPVLHAARCDSRQEGLDVQTFAGSLDVGDIALYLGIPGVGDRSHDEEGCCAFVTAVTLEPLAPRPVS